MFRKFSPMEKYIMNREDGSLNKLFAVGKGQLIDFYHFSTFKNEEGLEEMDEEKLWAYIKQTEKESTRKVIYMPNGEIRKVYPEDLVVK
jgi:hypothetical protein